MGPELRKVADTIMSDLGMGEDQGKIDALEQYLEENLSIFFSEDSFMSLRLLCMIMLQILTLKPPVNTNKTVYSICMTIHYTF